MRAAGWVLGLTGVMALLACAPATRGGPGSRAVDVAALAREADAEVARGCYECLRSAAGKYEAAVAAGGPVPAVRVAGAWVLVAARERELGLQPSDAVDRARGQRTALAGPPDEVIDAYLNVAGTLPHRIEGVSKETLGGSSQAIRAMLNLIEKAAESSAIERLRRAALEEGDVAAEYLLRSLDCAYNRNVITAAGVVVERPALLPPNPQPSSLLAFQAATCGGRRDPARDGSVLESLLQAEPRFYEAHYFLGHLRLLERKLVSAEREFLKAANGVPRMTAAWATLGATRLALEEYDWAAADIGRALDIEPRQREALLNHARALNYAGRYEEALVPAQRLVDLGAWFVSDANFWLAFSELHLGRLQDADRHVREAKRTNPMNADTARLSGLVAYRRAEFERAQQEFELALSSNPSDCESRLHLGLIHGNKARYELSVVAFVKARDCYAAAAVGAQSRAGEIETSSFPEARKEAARARLVQRVKAARRTQAAASLGAAEGETQRGAFEAALAYLQEAATESELGARVAELRTRIAALKALRQ
jgi:tetratricopeptide (TPR) repeat protein